MPPDTKQCTKCLEVKSVDEFYIRRVGDEDHKKGSPNSICKVCQSVISKEYRESLKKAVFALLGNKCNWPGCEWTDPMALCVDHVNGDGYKLRVRKPNGSNLRSGQSPFLKEVLKHPEKYQLLCENHNRIKSRLIDPILRKGKVKVNQHG